MNSEARRSQADTLRFLRIIGEQLERQNGILERIAENLENSQKYVAFQNESSYYLNQRLPDGEDGV